MEKLKSPKGFIVVLPGEIIEIPQDSDKSWLTLFYSLPRELSKNGNPLTICPVAPMRFCGRTSMTTSYEMICSSCLSETATHGAHGSFSK